MTPMRSIDISGDRASFLVLSSVEGTIELNPNRWVPSEAAIQFLASNAILSQVSEVNPASQGMGDLVLSQAKPPRP